MKKHNFKEIKPKELNEEQAQLLRNEEFEPNDFLFVSRSATNYSFKQKSNNAPLDIYY